MNEQTETTEAPRRSHYFRGLSLASAEVEQRCEHCGKSLLALQATGEPCVEATPDEVTTRKLTEDPGPSRESLIQRVDALESLLTRYGPHEELDELTLIVRKVTFNAASMPSSERQVLIREMGFCLERLKQLEPES